MGSKLATHCNAKLRKSLLGFSTVLGPNRTREYPEGSLHLGSEHSRNDAVKISRSPGSGEFSHLQGLASVIDNCPQLIFLGKSKPSNITSSVAVGRETEPKKKKK